MDVKKEFLKIMSEQKEIALATSVNNIPNVRIVNFVFDSTNNILYFSSFKVMIRLRKWNQTLILHLLQFHTLEMNT